MDSASKLLSEVNITADSPIVFIFLFTAFSLLPIILLGTTSYIKISVVFSILRNALGVGQVPSAGISSLLAIALTIHIMSPTVDKASSFFADGVNLHTKEIRVEKTKKKSKKKSLKKNEKLNGISIGALLEGGSKASIPLECFLAKNAGKKERKFFSHLKKIRTQKKVEAKSINNKEQLKKYEGGSCVLLKNESFSTLIPSFIISELKKAFIIGFRLFIPFLVIDLLVANILMGLGMMMVSPASISLPFKLLLFIVSDGWFLLCQSLVLGYQ